MNINIFYGKTEIATQTRPRGKGETEDDLAGNSGKKKERSRLAVMGGNKGWYSKPEEVEEALRAAIGMKKNDDVVNDE